MVVGPPGVSEIGPNLSGAFLSILGQGGPKNASITWGDRRTLESQMRIVLASASLARYPSGGGHWNWYLQYPFGLRDLGHDVVWLEVMRASIDHAHDVALIGAFLEKTARYGLAGRVVVALTPETPLGNLDQAEIHG